MIAAIEDTEILLNHYWDISLYRDAEGYFNGRATKKGFDPILVRKRDLIKLLSSLAMAISGADGTVEDEF